MYRIAKLGILVAFASVIAAQEPGGTEGAEEGPDSPDFVANDGELESDVRPNDKPKGNYNVLEDKGVYVLHRDTFAHFLMDKPLVMVEFYAPWCGHCKKLTPEYKKAADKLKEHGLILAKVDGTKEGELAKEHMIQGYPTLYIFRYGEKVEQYNGPKTADDIVKYMLRMNDPNWQPPPSVVVNLVSENFTQYVKNKDISLVMWYAPWCKHCKQVKPEYEGAAEELRGWGIPLAKVDGTSEKELADQFQIGGWPAFKIFRKGRVYDYKGPREKDNIVEFMRRQAMEPSEEKNHFLGITNNLDRYEITVVGFFKGKSDLYDEYMVAANEMRDTFKFMHTLDEKVAESFNVPQETVAVFMPEIFWTKYENKTYALTKKSATYKEIMTFVRRNSVPLVGWRTTRNMFKYTERPLVVLYYDVNYHHNFISDTQYTRNMIVEVAKHFKGSNLKFAISSEEEFEKEIASLGFEDSGNEINLGVYTEKQKFRGDPEEEFSSEYLAEYIEKLRTGRVSPYMKSLPVPKTQDGLVKKVVADNYDVEMHKVKKDVVIFFHAPWCGHCKEFDIVFKKVAKKMSKSNENILFGKMDGTANDIPYMFPPLKGFPSVFFLSAYEKFDPIQYQGDRSYKSVKDWINRHSSIFLTEEERTGQAAEDDEEIASFTDEDFDMDGEDEEDEEDEEGEDGEEEEEEGEEEEEEAESTDKEEL